MRSLVTLFVFLLIKPLLAQVPVVEFNGEKSMIIEQLQIIRDSSYHYKVPDFKSGNPTQKLQSAKLNLDHTDDVLWARFELVNKTDIRDITIRVENPMIDSISLYQFIQEGGIRELSNFMPAPFSKRVYNSGITLFNLHLRKGERAQLLLRVKSSEHIILPILIDSTRNSTTYATLRDMVYGLFAGIVLVMFFYNVFIYFSTRDRSYLIYVIYIFFIGIAQLSMSGHTYQFLFPNAGWIYKYTIVVFPALSGMFAVLFLRDFMSLKEVAPVKDKIILFFVFGGYLAAAVSRLLNGFQLSSLLMDLTGAFGAIFVLYTSFLVAKKGNRSAKFFIVAWTFFIVGIISFVFRNLDILPFNFFTTFAMPAGAASEVVLLSFALADRINILQKQKREKEEEAYQQALENQRIISEQNVELEKRVNQRTLELRESNDHLTKALQDLKDAQTQLVDQEKMASLGQLTAGIAHEINNPINFVTSNINPLRRDVKMLLELFNQVEELAISPYAPEEVKRQINELKEEMEFDYLIDEINHLLKGIDEGANRTAYIVKGLRIFSRTDEDVIKKADIVEGIESTLIILNNQLGKISVEKSFSGDRIIDCYPGKLNQVFLNLLSNAIYAIRAKWNQEAGGVIHISVESDGNEMTIGFRDNGSGMKEEVVNKMFEPFFTTKPVGEGTGLGLSIVYKTIERHRGKITVKSVWDEGSLFEIKLPVYLNA